MNNELTSYEQTEIDDGWENAADEASERLLRGTLLKFSDGRWTAGQNTTPLQEGTRLTALGTAAAWVRWDAGKPAEYIIRKKGERLAERKELGFLDESTWEKMPDGKPRDPWQSTRFVYLVDQKTAEAFTFSTSSSGGRGAVSDLGDQIQRMRFGKRGAVPVIEITSTLMNTKFGKKWKPVLKIVEWVGGNTPATQPKQIEHNPAKTPVRGDMDDAIPFS